MSSSALFSATLTPAFPTSALLEGSFIIRRLASRNPLVSTQTATCQVRIFQVDANGRYIPAAYMGTVRIDSELGGNTLPGVALVGADGTSEGLAEVVEFKVAAALDYIFVYAFASGDFSVNIRIEVVV